jgi:Dynein heavy chain, N-terminal region 1
MVNQRGGLACAGRGRACCLQREPQPSIHVCDVEEQDLQSLVIRCDAPRLRDDHLAGSAASQRLQATIALDDEAEAAATPHAAAASPCQVSAKASRSAFNEAATDDVEALNTGTFDDVSSSPEAMAPGHVVPTSNDGAPCSPDTSGHQDAARLAISWEALESHRDAQAAIFLIKSAPTGDVDDSRQPDIEIGTFAGSDMLQNVGTLLEHVYIPMLSANAAAGSSAHTSMAVSGQQQSVDSDTLAAMHRFLSSLRTSAAHLTGNVQLKVPDIDIDGAGGKDDDILMLLESTVHEWTLVLQNVKQSEATKEPAGSGPLDEITFWNERNSVLSSMHEQIQSAKAQDIIRSALSCSSLPCAPRNLQPNACSVNTSSCTCVQVCGCVLPGPSLGVHLPNARCGAVKAQHRVSRQRQVPWHIGAPLQGHHRRASDKCVALARDGRLAARTLAYRQVAAG